MLWRRSTTAKNRTKRPGRRRLLAGWLLLVIGVLITGVWGASGWWSVGLKQPTWVAGVRRGYVVVVTDSKPGTMAGYDVWRFDDLVDPSWKWWFQAQFVQSNVPPIQRVVNFGVAYGAYNGGDGQVRFLLWPFALVALLGGGWLVWSGRRARRRAASGACLKCGYDLSGLGAGSVCPECGGGKGAA